MDRKLLLEELNADQVRKVVNNNSIAFLILGSCENHGDHLPFGSDSIFPMNLAKIISDDIVKSNPSSDHNCFILPVIPYGVSIHHNDFQMTMSLKFSTMISMIEDVLDSLAKNNIKKVVIINGHDGNIAPIEVASRNLKNRYPDMIIACLESWWVLVGQKNSNLFNVWSGLGHGGEAETSVMMAIRPDLVDIRSAPEQIIPNLPSDDIRLYWKFSELTTTGATGAPKEASVQKGQEIIDILKRVVLDFINKMNNSNWKYGVSTSNFE
ncbi:creatininase family protein [Candidatus Nitrosocosmicus sp. T]